MSIDARSVITVWDVLVAVSYAMKGICESIHTQMTPQFAIHSTAGLAHSFSYSVLDIASTLPSSLLLPTRNQTIMRPTTLWNSTIKVTPSLRQTQGVGLLESIVHQEVKYHNRVQEPAISNWSNGNLIIITSLQNPLLSPS